MMEMIGSRAGVVAVSLVVATAMGGCSQVPTMRGEIEGLAKIAEQAERNGALRCAPRELAMAKSHLQNTNLTTLGIFFDGFLVSPAVIPKLSVPPSI